MVGVKLIEPLQTYICFRMHITEESVHLERLNRLLISSDYVTVSGIYDMFRSVIRNAGFLPASINMRASWYGHVRRSMILGPGNPRLEF